MTITTEVSVKTCSKCKITHPVSNFYHDYKRPDTLCPQCKDCMRKNALARRERGQERVVQREWRKKQRSSPQGRYRATRLIQDAKTRGECSLDQDWVSEKIETGFCEISGIPFDLSGQGSPPNCFTPSLDRIDPAKGYHPDNVKVVVWIYNRAKGPNTLNDVLTFCKAMIANHND